MQIDFWLVGCLLACLLAARTSLTQAQNTKKKLKAIKYDKFFFPVLNFNIQFRSPVPFLCRITGSKLEINFLQDDAGATGDGGVQTCPA